MLILHWTAHMGRIISRVKADAHSRKMSIGIWHTHPHLLSIATNWFSHERIKSNQVGRPKHFGLHCIIDRLLYWPGWAGCGILFIHFLLWNLKFLSAETIVHQLMVNFQQAKEYNSLYIFSALTWWKITLYSEKRSKCRIVERKIITLFWLLTCICNDKRASLHNKINLPCSKVPKFLYWI